MKCKECGHTIGLILHPFEKFKKQLDAMFDGYCSTRCKNLNRPTRGQKDGNDMEKKKPVYYVSTCPDTGRQFLVQTGKDGNIIELTAKAIKAIRSLVKGR